MGEFGHSGRYLELSEKDREKVNYVIAYLNTGSVAAIKTLLFAVKAEIDIMACLPSLGRPCLQEPLPASQ